MMRSRKNRKGQRPPRVVKMEMTHPPAIRPQITHTQRLRFVTNANIQQTNISFQNLLDAMLVATSATVAFDIFDAVKVKSVEMWSLFTNDGTPVTVNVSFPGGVTGGAGDAKEHADTSVGISPAHLHVRPDRTCAAAMWQGSSTFVAFQLTCPSQTVIDVEVSFRNTIVAPVSSQNAIAGATTGQFYYRGLDGIAVATTKFTPQALNPA
jgi:hypothetical protein